MATAKIIERDTTRLNAICPYFTMFPLDFPLGILRRHAEHNATVIDPFCGRGTTNFAARLLGLKTIGIDVSRVATAATHAKLVAPTPQEIVDAAKLILNRKRKAAEVPRGEFWRLAYEERVLLDICRFREALLDGSVESDIAAALRGIILGALHGPVNSVKRSYFSNQSPRTYGPKPAYAVRFWKERRLSPPFVSVLEIIGDRAQRFYGTKSPKTGGAAVEGDSRDELTLEHARNMVGKFDWVITSPPYYGLKTYLSDQWIRSWFLGGSSTVDYICDSQLSHGSRDRFIADLNKVWNNAGYHCRAGAKLVVRFGSIGDRLIEDPAELIKETLQGTAWVTTTIRHAKNASSGKRQADTFHKNRSVPCDEVDVWAQWRP